jgi:hypothetical protein
VTRPTPETWLIFCARRVLTRFCTSVSGMRVGADGQREHRRVGRVDLGVHGRRRQVGRQQEPPALMAACTSCSATSSVWPSENCSVMMDTPAALVELMRSSPDIWPNWRSSGAVTVRLITSGLPPGYSVCTWMVG